MQRLIEGSPYIAIPPVPGFAKITAADPTALTVRL